MLLASAKRELDRLQPTLAPADHDPRLRGGRPWPRRGRAQNPWL